MSERPTRCKVPNNVWFNTEGSAVRNAERKGDDWTWWKCYDHWHVRPKRPIPRGEAMKLQGVRAWLDRYAETDRQLVLADSPIVEIVRKYVESAQSQSRRR